MQTLGLKAIHVLFGDEKVKNLCDSIGTNLPGVLYAFKEDRKVAWRMMPYGLECLRATINNVQIQMLSEKGT